MAYLLRNTSSGNTRVNIPQFVLSNIGDYLEYKGVALTGNPDDLFRLAGRQDGFTSLVELAANSLFVRFDGANLNRNNNENLQINDVFTVKIVKVAETEWHYYINGAQISTASTSNSLIIDQLMNLASSDTLGLRGELHHFEVGDAVGVLRYYDPSASNGTGSVLPDTVGSNDGTLVNFPTDDSQWVYYDDGSSTTPTLTAKITGITATSAVPVIDVTF